MGSFVPDLHPPDADPASRTVLYVEDHPVNVLLMQAVFTKRPHLRLLVAVDGESAWHAAHAHRIDLLLLDLHLPDCHGSDLLHRLRALPALADVPAVAVTADVTRDVERDGFAELWRKPMDVNETLQRLDHLLGAGTEAVGTSLAPHEGWTGPPATPLVAPGSRSLTSMEE